MNEKVFFVSFMISSLAMAFNSELPFFCLAVFLLISRSRGTVIEFWLEFYLVWPELEFIPIAGNDASGALDFLGHVPVPP